MTIVPTTGRVVWFYERFVSDTPEPQPMAAIVTYVHGDRLVNLTVFDANGVAAPRTSVPLRQPGEIAPNGMFCEWMPYQVGQAKKADADFTGNTDHGGERGIRVEDKSLD